MNQAQIGVVVWVVLLVALFRLRRRRRGRIGSASIGAIYDMLNKDKRNAVEIIVEQRAGERDPEDRDDKLPDLNRPKREGSD